MTPTPKNPDAERLAIDNDVQSRFWQRVNVRGKNECWEWTGTRSNGYGSIRVSGKTRKATHVSWEIANGKPFPKGMLACHRCDNPPCVNPAHLFVGTLADNARDMVEKGRHTLRSLTHCFKGHEYTPENTRTCTRKDGTRRVCLTCQAEYQAAYFKRRQAAATKETGK